MYLARTSREANMSRKLIPLALLLLAPVLTGCKTGYTVEVRNNTSAPATAAVYKDELIANDPQLKTQWIGPGDRATLGPFESRYGIGLYVQVDSESNPGYPAKADLRKGYTVFNLETDNGEAGGALVLKKIR